jgi:hypothetical protein
VSGHVCFRPIADLSRQLSALVSLRTGPLSLPCGMHFAGIGLILAVGALSASAAAQVSAPLQGAEWSGTLRLTAPSTCSATHSSSDLVVCGKRSDRFRIPKELRKQPPSSPSHRSRLALSGDDFAPCGIFQGERRCGKREAAEYGYGQGRDPITVAIKVIGALTDPDK